MLDGSLILAAWVAALAFAAWRIFAKEHNANRRGRLLRHFIAH